MSLTSDPLAAYRLPKEKKEEEIKVEERAKESPTKDSSDPLSAYRMKSDQKVPEKKGGYRDVVSEELRAAGYEPDFSEELERAAEYGTAEAWRGVLSGASFGLTKAIPGLRPEEGVNTTVNEVVGSALLPVGSAIKAGKYAVSPLIKLASNSPKIQKSISALGHLIGISGLGAVGGAISEATEDEELKIPSVENALEHGAMWAAVDVALQGLGLTGRFAKALFSKSKATGVDRVSLLTDTIQKAEALGGSEEKVAKTALDILEGRTPESAQKIAEKQIDQQAAQKAQSLKDRKVEVKDFTKLKHTPPMPYLPGEFQFEKVADSAINTDLQASIDSVGERASSEKILGENIQKDLEQQFDIRKQETDALYTEAAEGMETKYVNLNDTATALFKNIQRIQKGGIKLSPEGYSKAEKQLLQALEDIGFAPVLDTDGKRVIDVIKESDTELSKAVDIKKRINNIIDYDLKETGAQDFLKDPAHSLRGDIRRGYGSKENPQRVAFEKAEKLFGENAEQAKKKSITSSRYSEKPESIAKLIKTPSGLHDLKQNVSPDQFKQIEREVLEHINSLPEEKARNFYREIRGDLSSDAKIVAEEIIESKAPLPPSSRKHVQRSKIQDSVLEDISKASITGERPDKALNLWKTKEGQQIIKHSLDGNPNKQEIIQYLSDTSFNDFASSIVNPSGEINFKKLNEFLKDPATRENIRLVAGEEGLNFFNQLEKISNEAKKNFSVIEGVIDKGSASERAKIDKQISSRYNRFDKHKELQKEAAESKNKLVYKLDDFLKSYGIKTKALLALLGIVKLGTPETLALAGSYEALRYMAKNKKVRQAMRQAAVPKQSPVNYIKAYEAIDNATDDQ
jgi:hypothetical protein